ncbi:GNAT family N-acetyltransferase [Parendozoicomonas haliclonae]|uniref:Putative acetyltransferase n=1 Tax=Parendozoicomonas haliclonae TaxID=1960125 RepID=A0A1X7AQQ9_9GAMM|nr:GNAT family N-acetyltransferase [Parendozoicomonas haliclonae]SMA50429.1 putative acetyltransferase [Parendozoicomonas haliclonae]
MSYTLRIYQQEDLQAVLDCWEASSRFAHTFLSDEQIADERQQVADIYLPNTESWVVDVDGVVVGFVGLIVPEEKSVPVEVGGLFVLPECHGLGYGKALLNKATERHGVLELEVFEVNANGRGFYLHYGFELIAPAGERYGQPLLRLRYTP